jgi:hypothetical protein
MGGSGGRGGHRIRGGIPGLRLEEAFAQAPVDLGAGDTGVLNYAYALEQLEAAFYTEVWSNIPTRGPRRT